MSKIIHNPHDKLVKIFLKEDTQMAIDLLNNHLPANITETLDFSTLVLTSESAIDDKWKEFRNDVLFKCKTKEKDDAYIYMLIEHQSTPDPFMPFRLLRYEVNILGKYLDAEKKPKKLPNIVSFVIYQNEKAYPHPKDLPSCFKNKEMATKRFNGPMLMQDLTQISSEDIVKGKGRDIPLKLILKWATQKKAEKFLEEFLKNAEIFVNLHLKQARQMVEYISFVIPATPENEKMMKHAIQKVYGKKRGKRILTLGEYYQKEAEERGIEQGIQQGVQKGKEEGLKEGIEEGLKEGIKEGIEEGLKEGIKMINSMLREGLITKKVAEEKIRKLKEKTASKNAL